jgi:hypothetical protein
MSRTLLSLAGFQVILSGRFWVIAEAKKGALGDVLRLFSLRYAWLKCGDQQAYRELVRARRAADADIRQTAEIILSEMTTEKQGDGPSDE